MNYSKRVIKSTILLSSICFLASSFQTADAVPSYNFSKLSLKEKIIKQSLEQGVDPALALSLVKQESAFNKDARSYVGAIGLFQLMPQTARDLGVNPYYVNDNIKGGIKYLKMMKQKFGRNDLALAAYNAGPGAVQRYRGIPPYRETRNYVRNIMRTYKNYQRYPDPLIQKVQKEHEEGDSIKLAVKDDFSIGKIFTLKVLKNEVPQNNEKLSLFGVITKWISSFFV